jgi:hypothetical protein
MMERQGSGTCCLVGEEDRQVTILLLSHTWLTSNNWDWGERWGSAGDGDGVQAGDAWDRGTGARPLTPSVREKGELDSGQG